jgi:hypothetical protein
LRHASRLYDLARRGHEPSVEQLRRIEAQDILKSRVFSEETHEEEAAAPAAAAPLGAVN